MAMGHSRIEVDVLHELFMALGHPASQIEVDNFIGRIGLIIVFSVKPEAHQAAG